jgi:hypothetical protein
VVVVGTGTGAVGAGAGVLELAAASRASGQCGGGDGRRTGGGTASGSEPMMRLSRSAASRIACLRVARIVVAGTGTVVAGAGAGTGARAGAA